MSSERMSDLLKPIEQLSAKTKRTLSNKYSDSEIATALRVVADCKQPAFLTALLHAALEGKWQPKESNIQKIEEAQEFLDDFTTQWDGKKIRDFSCECGPDYIQLVHQNPEKNQLFRLHDRHFITTTKHWVSMP